MHTTSTDTAVQKMDRLNLRPALDFIATHGDIYEGFVHDLMTLPSVAINAVDEFTTLDEHLVGDSVHVTGDEALEIFSRLPASFQKLSMLQNINYHFARMIPVPIFEEGGEWKEAVEIVEESKFPREAANDHPHRILIGRCDGTMIYPSALPVCVHDSVRVRWMYQLHVMLHEFFHTIEFLRRDSAIAQKIILRSGANLYTFHDWWHKWEDLFRTPLRPLCPTRYAQTYVDALTAETPQGEFTRALAEQVCESFVGYVMGIVPNDEDDTSFKHHSPEAWELMNELATSEVIEVG